MMARRLLAAMLAAFAFLVIASDAYAQGIKRLDFTMPLQHLRNWGALHENILPNTGRHVTSIQIADISTEITRRRAAGVYGTLEEIIITVEGTTAGTRSQVLFHVNGTTFSGVTPDTDNTVPRATSMTHLEFKMPHLPAGDIVRATSITRKVTPGSVLEVYTSGASDTAVIAHVDFVIKTYPMNETDPVN